MSNECAGLFGKWFGHSFEARFDTKESRPDVGLSSFSGPAYIIPQILAEGKMCDKHYVHDICTRCGKIIYREEQFGTRGCVPNPEYSKESKHG